jgi:RHS repeat-associated protein
MRAIGFSALFVLAAVSASAQAPESRLEPGNGARRGTTTELSERERIVTGGLPAGSVSGAILVVDDEGPARPVGELLVPRVGHSATVLPSGDVLIAGGIDASGQPVPVVERLDPRTWQSTVISLPWTPRAEHSATVLPDGRVVFLGGTAYGSSVTTVDVWNSLTGEASTVPTDWPQPRSAHKADLQGDGTVIIRYGQTLGAEVPEEPVRFSIADGSFAPVRGEARTSVQARAVIMVPPPGAAGVDRGVVPLASFSAAVVAGPDLRAEVTSADGTMPARVVRLEGGRLWAIVPTATLEGGVSYRVSLTGLRDRAGRDLPATRTYFTTAADVQPTATHPSEDDETWVPRPGRWRTDRPASPWAQLPLLEAADGVTALSGRVLLLNGSPLRGVTVRMGERLTETDATGRFLLREVPAGQGQLIIDGRSASRPGRRFGVFVLRVTAAEGLTTKLGFTSWMPRLDERGAVNIPSPTSVEMIITTPAIPGLELHVPAGTVVRDHEGNIVREVSITAIPVDRPPFPLPDGVEVPIYFTIQPGNGYLEGIGAWPKGARLVYPNYGGDRPGARVNFWHYDPDGRGWHVYGLGSVDASGRQVVPDEDVRLYSFSGAMINSGNTPPPEGPDGLEAGDPVDISTGLFVYRKTDLYVSDLSALALTRTYRSRDRTSRPFGVGATHPYAMFLWSANQYQEADLVLPDGARIHYGRISAGNDFINAVFEHTATPGPFYKSRLAWNGNGWTLRRKDGTEYQFGDVAPLQSIRDRYGNTTTITWSSVNASGAGTGRIARINSPNGRWIEFDYDASDRITLARDNIGRSVSYTYDAAGRLWTVTDAAGGVTEYTYDASDRMVTVKDPRGIVFLTNEYDANGRVVRQTQADSTTFEFAYTLDGAGRVVQTDVTNPRGVVERTVFNTAGQRLVRTEALGTPLSRTTTYTREATSQRVEAIVDPLNRRTELGYDGMGNLTSVTRLAGTAHAITSTWTHEPVYHQVATTTDPLNHTTSFTYDGFGRLTAISDALSRQWSVTLAETGQPAVVANPLSQTTELEYASGDLRAVVNGLGRRVTFEHDAAGRRLSTTDPLGHRTQVTYTPLNLVAAVTDARNGQTSFTYDGNGNLLTLTDPRSAVTTYTYDVMDRVATRTDPVNQAESYLYDANGNLQQITDREGQVTAFTYDALDRLATATYHDSSTATYTYDAGDRLLQIVDTAAGTITRTYDDLDRLTSETTAEGTVSYTYDAAGRRTTMTASGQLPVSYGYDAAHQLTSVTQGTATVTLGYDLAGRRASLVLPNGITTTSGYDAADQLTSLTWTTSGGPLGDLTYAYDAAGRRTGVGGSFARTGIPPALTAATYDLANRIQTWGGQAFTYDLNGNLTSDGSATFTWNVRDQLTAVGGGSPGTFSYDAVGRRRTRTVGGVTTSYLYDLLDTVQEQVGGSASANYLLGESIDERFARNDGTGTSWYLLDPLQSTIALVDGTGTVQTSYTYEPFGATTQSGAATANPAGLTGREEDGTGLYFYRARYYDPRRQRFVSEDSWGFAAGDVNLFAYVGNAPTQHNDPTGHIGPAAAMALGCAVGAGASILPDILAGRKVNWPLAYAGCGLGAVGGFAAAGVGGSGAAAAAAAAGAAGGSAGTAAGAAMSRAAARGADAVRYGSHSLGAAEPVLPRNARSTMNATEVFRRLQQYHGIDQVTASQRLHDIKAASGRGPADNVLFDLTGGVYDPVTRRLLGHLTQGGGR